MKKTMKKSVLIAGAMLLVAGVAQAKIVGNCSDCHTMHNSEEGNPVAIVQGWAGVSPTPNEVLLKMDCMSCHASGSGDAVDTLAGGSLVPQVYGTAATDLAGGNFAYIDGTKGSGADDRKGHNVIDILSADATLTGPPGYARGPADDLTNNTSVHTFAMASQFTCAGKAGCHGVRNQSIAASGVTGQDANGIDIIGEVYHPRTGLAALTGAHHYDEGGSLAVADDIYNSYRFLMGTTGFESDTWSNTAADHNEYSGANAATFAAGFSGCDRCHETSHSMSTAGYVTNRTGTITNFCETCHSNFHSSQDDDYNGNTGAFLRHPSDFVIRDKTEYAKMTAWDASAPVARDGVPAAMSSTAGPGDVVACLSCHVAHASDNAHMLRFDYTAITAGAGSDTTGCFVCHNTKDTGDGNDWANPMLQ
jgi:Zn-finger protein